LATAPTRSLLREFVGAAGGKPGFIGPAVTEQQEFIDLLTN
jgi:hypothetical protein